MTVKEAAEKMEISKTLCYLLIEEGRLGHLRIGQMGRPGKIIVREKDIEEFLKKCEVRPDAK